jgi:KDO2-lipid IV(A) lauroyltransferase
MLTRWAIGLLWLLHFLPLSGLRILGSGLGRLLYLLGTERRHVTDINLQLCFPQMSAAQRRRIAREHFRWVGCSFLERGLLFYAPAARIERLVRVRGIEHLMALVGKVPVIILTGHFTGTEAALIRLTMLTRIVNVYSTQKNPVVNHWLLRGRSRFGDPLMFSRLDNIRKAVRAIKAGLPMLYLPDMDFGPRDALFIPFFKGTAATITGLSRLARLSGAVVVPMVTRMTDQGYDVEIQPPWEQFPGDSEAENARRQNAWVEVEVMRGIEQYYWVHKRFKTRPPGEIRVY